jgi:hypothetical protein
LIRATLGPLDLHVHRASEVHGLKSREYSNMKSRKLQYAISRQSKDSVWATAESASGGQVARAIGVSWRESPKH